MMMFSCNCKNSSASGWRIALLQINAQTGVNVYLFTFYGTHLWNAVFSKIPKMSSNMASGSDLFTDIGYMIIR